MKDKHKERFLNLEKVIHELDVTFEYARFGAKNFAALARNDVVKYLVEYLNNAQTEYNFEHKFLIKYKKIGE